MALDPPIPVNVLIRPRGGDFVYTDVEIAAMLADIAAAGAHGAAGVVVGVLTKEGTVDVVTSSKLIEAARSAGLQVTFHRAIDMTSDIMAAFRTVLELNVDMVLTSGGCNTAVSYKPVLVVIQNDLYNRYIFYGRMHCPSLSVLILDDVGS